MWSLADWFAEEIDLIVVDVGAALGESPSYQPLVDMGFARVIGFEPDADACEKLQGAYGAQHVFLPYFVGDGGTATFHETNWSQTGSLYAPNTPLLEEFNNLGEHVVPVATHLVKTRRLDDIAEISDIDFLKIDVQGSELSVFRNGQRRLADVLLIQAEVAFVETYIGQPMFSDVDAFLRSAGFQFHDFVGFGSRSLRPMVNPESPDGAFRQKIWADAFYIRDWATIEKLTDSKLRNFAVLMHDILESFDVAHRCLRELDRRSSGGLASRYLARLQAENLCSVEEPGTGEHQGGATGTERPAGPPIAVVTGAGDNIVVPSDLSCITSYVLLEQERWFEREVGFVCRYLSPGMNACDVGANLGVYSVPMARRVAPSGRVVAFEPGSLARACLGESVRCNGLASLEVLPLALGDIEKAGWLELGVSGELNAVTAKVAEDREAEEIRISTLDREILEARALSIDFVKIDAEGMEARVIAGGRGLFRQQSPLVMYEVKHGASHNESLRWMFEALGYGTFRLSGNGDYLVAVGSDESIDRFELNYFAAKPDRAALLAERGLLVGHVEPFGWLAGERDAAMQSYLALSFAGFYEIAVGDVSDCPYGEALLACVASRREDCPPARRHAALLHAEKVLREYLEGNAGSVGARCTLVRVLLDLGRVAGAVLQLSMLLAQPSLELDHPFLPPAARYEFISPDIAPNDWLNAAIAEAYELSRMYSTRFGHADLKRIDWLAGLPFASPEILRRAILIRQQTAGSVENRLFVRLHEVDPQGRNRALWTQDALNRLS